MAARLPRLGGLGYGIAITGDKELVAKLQLLTKSIQERIIRKAVKAGGGPIEKAARAYAPVQVAPRGMKRAMQVGLLKKSLGMKVGQRRRDKAAYAVIGPRSGFRMQLSSGEYKDPRRYAHLVERGTSHSAAKPFLTPALATEGGHALDIIGTEVWAGVEAELRK